jgi:hypothetical protein
MSTQSVPEQDWEWCSHCRKPMPVRYGKNAQRVKFCDDPECLMSRKREERRQVSERQHFRAMSEVDREIHIYRRIWLEGWRPSQVIREMGASNALYQTVNRLKNKHGAPSRKCQCGLKALHAGHCYGGRSHRNPECTQCGGRTKRSGFAPQDQADEDGFRRRVYSCIDCKRSFVESPKVISAKALAARQDKVYQMVWEEREKHTYIATVLRVSLGTVARDVAELKKTYGEPPACDCGRKSGHHGPCKVGNIRKRPSWNEEKSRIAKSVYAKEIAEAEKRGYERAMREMALRSVAA